MSCVRWICPVVLSFAILAGCNRPAEQKDSPPVQDGKNTPKGKGKTKSDPAGENPSGNPADGAKPKAIAMRPGQELQLVDDPMAPIMLRITSKLGVKKDVECTRTRHVKGTVLENERINHVEAIIRRSGNIDIDKGLAIDSEKAFTVFIPLRYVSTAEIADKQTAVTMTDGRVHRGGILTCAGTEPTLDDGAVIVDLGGPVFDLKLAASELVNLKPVAGKKADPERVQFILKIGTKKGVDSVVQAFDVYAPPGFSIEVGQVGQQVSLNVIAANFERIVVLPTGKGAGMQVTVKAPESPEKSGTCAAFDNVFETTNGVFVLVDGGVGFVLERKPGLR